MSDQIEWVTIMGGAKIRPIGAVGLLEGKVAVIASVFDPYDGNQDGKVSTIEWIAGTFLSPIKLKNSAIAQVAYAASRDYEVLTRDPDFAHEGERIWLQFVRGTVTDGAYLAWFSASVSGSGKAMMEASHLGGLKQFIIRKGMEQSVKKLYHDSAK